MENPRLLYIYSVIFFQNGNFLAGTLELWNSGTMELAGKLLKKYGINLTKSRNMELT